VSLVKFSIKCSLFRSLRIIHGHCSYHDLRFLQPKTVQLAKTALVARDYYATASLGSSNYTLYLWIRLFEGENYGLFDNEH